MAWYVKVFCLLNGVLTEVEHASPAQQEVIESSDQAIVTVCATATRQMEVSRVKSESENFQLYTVIIMNTHIYNHDTHHNSLVSNCYALNHQYLQQ